MTTTITAVDNETTIEHGVLIDVVINGTTFYISNSRYAVTYNGHSYTPLAGFLSVSEIQNNISNTNSDIQIGLSGIATSVFNAIDLLNAQIKGGSINVYRAFFSSTQHNQLTNEVYPRFKGTMVNFSAQEDLKLTATGGEVTHSITIIASSIMGVLEHRVAGRRTNPKDYKIYYAEHNLTTAIATDPSMDRVEILSNASFDFGKPYVAPIKNSTGTQSVNTPVTDTQTFQGY